MHIVCDWLYEFRDVVGTKQNDVSATLVSTAANSLTFTSSKQRAG